MNLLSLHTFLGWTSGALFSLLNLILLKRLAKLLADSLPSKRQLILLIFLKFGLLYPIGLALLFLKVVSLGAFTCGFSAVLVWSVFHVMRPSPEKVRND